MFSKISNLFIVCIMLVVVCGVQQVEAGTWAQKADMPTARSIAGSAVVDGKIYVIGGAPVPYGYTAAVEEYDPATDTWTRRADMPTARQGVRAAAVDGIIYAIGGWHPSNDVLTPVEAYDPATDKWITKADMPTARNLPAVAVVDGRIYVIGGYSFHPHRTVLSAVEAYDPATDTWTRKTNIPTARFLAAACVLDGRIYVSGGSPNFFGSTDLPTVEVYDPATDTWTQASDMPVARYRHAASAVDGKMYIIGGQEEEMVKLWREGKIEEDEMAQSFSVVYVYDPAADTWTTSANPLPTARVGLTAAVVDGKIYAIGGGRGDPYELLSIVEEFDPGLPGALSSVSPAGKLLETWGHVKKVE